MIWTVVGKCFNEPSKALFYLFLYVKYWGIRAFGRRRTIFVTPMALSRPYMMWKIAHYLGLKAGSAEEACIGIVHDYHTWIELPDEGAADRQPGIRLLNARCRDISKKHLSQLHREVFGYDCNVDPCVHTGPMVQKSDENSTHDGRVIHGPIDAATDGYVYQHLVNNQVDSKTVMDLRLCVVGDYFPFALCKYRPVAQRFSNENTSVEVTNASSLFSAVELTKIHDLCGNIGLDVGELDIVRSRDDGRIYILDINKTPHSPPDLLANYKGIPLVRRAALCFKLAFLS